MRIRDLEARFIRRTPEGYNEYPGITIHEADGVIFLCPKCLEQNGGPVGTHSILCWFTGKVPDDLSPGPGRWNPSGSGIDDLTFVEPGKVSVQLLSGCSWHGHITNGQALTC